MYKHNEPAGRTASSDRRDHNASDQGPRQDCLVHLATLVFSPTTIATSILQSTGTLRRIGTRVAPSVKAAICKSYRVVRTLKRIRSDVNELSALGHSTLVCFVSLAAPYGWERGRASDQWGNCILPHSYAERSQNLTALGFTSYADYLRADLWFEIRGRVLPHGCVSCGEMAEQIHHERYDLKTLKGGNLAGLLPVCKRCHRKAERWGRQFPVETRVRLVTEALRGGVVSRALTLRSKRRRKKRRLDKAEWLARHHGQIKKLTDRTLRQRVERGAGFDPTPRLVRR